jgi:membrane-associated phospholipid phosphatase
MVRRPYVIACAVAVATGLLAVIGALALDLPFRDPDGFIGPAYIRLPVIVLFFLLLDIAPSVVRQVRAGQGVPSALRRVSLERWSLSRLALVIAGLSAFYVTYVGYRNLKGYLPFVREELVDEPLHALDRTLMLGNDPGPWLHDVLGTGFSAHVLSLVYVSYLLFVPISLAAALVWSRDMSRGFWYVTALCLNWTLGVLSYYTLPSLGPVFAYPYLYEGLPETGVASLQESLLKSRYEILANPEMSSAIQGIAGFASLHVSVVFTAALFCHRARSPKPLRWSLWVYLGLTVLATLYFGWHYILDDIAGFGIGWLSVAVGQRVTGNKSRAGDPVAPAPPPEDGPVLDAGNGTGPGRPAAAPTGKPPAPRAPRPTPTVAPVPTADTPAARIEASARRKGSGATS